MCGIAGIVDFEGAPVPERLVTAMCRTICHRGPDEEGVRRVSSTPPGSRGAQAVLGSRRLAIIDIVGGQQPIANEDRTIWTVLNGEIYNFLALRTELEQRGHRFATHSDTEVIVHLYEEFGERFVARLDGMFALALWDDRTNTLILARDRFGKKPLLYADGRERIAFGSEMQAVLADASIGVTLDSDAIGDYLTFMAIPHPRTIYREVRKLPPASYLVRRAGRTEVHEYWRLEYGPKLSISEAEAETRIVELLRAAVERRLMSEVPLGAFLSGGIDSSAVVACMAQASSRPVQTFSIGFEDQAYNELPYARMVAARYGCEHREFVVQPHAVEVLPLLARHFGEPYADSSAIPSYYLARMTRAHVTVALNGDGGDEAFAGYGWHLASRLSERWQRLPAGARAAATGLIETLVPEGADRKGRGARLRRFLRGAGLDRPSRYRAWIGLFTADAQRDLLINPAPGTDLERLFAPFASLDAVDAMLAADVALYLPADLLPKVDITTMANSLEARSPFLDRELTEFVARLPSRMKVRGRTSKYILKRALRHLLPPEILYRRKKGFAVPIASWLRGELREFAADHLLSPTFASRGLFKPAAVAGLLERHQRSQDDFSHHLWILLMFDLWAREVHDARASTHAAVATD
jgi:asparagine synthase (glutamine-hydrolysing)